MSKEPRDLTRFWGWLAFLAVMVAIGMVFLYAPTERIMGDIQRIFYFHVASAWNGFLAFAVVFVYSIIYLRTGSRKADVLAYCSAEIGVLFTTIVLLTGPIWARVSWNTWWTWDPRLTTTLILWFIYLAYLVIRASAEGSEQQARFAAVFGIIGFVDVPIVWVAARWWRSIHPTLTEGTKMRMEPPMTLTLIVSVLAFTLLYLFFLSARSGVERLKQEVFDLKQSLRG